MTLSILNTHRHGLTAKFLNKKQVAVACGDIIPDVVWDGMG